MLRTQVHSIFHARLRYSCGGASRSHSRLIARETVDIVDKASTLLDKTRSTKDPKFLFLSLYITALVVKAAESFPLLDSDYDGIFFEGNLIAFLGCLLL